MINQFLEEKKINPFAIVGLALAVVGIVVGIKAVGAPNPADD